MKKPIRISKPTRLPTRMYDFLRDKAKKNETSMRIEANKMYEDYSKLKQLEAKLEKKRGKIIIVR